jgi:hypothetical protein
MDSRSPPLKPSPRTRQLGTQQLLAVLAYACLVGWGWKTSVAGVRSGNARNVDATRTLSQIRLTGRVPGQAPAPHAGLLVQSDQRSVMRERNRSSGGGSRCLHDFRWSSEVPCCLPWDGVALLRESQAPVT